MPGNPQQPSTDHYPDLLESMAGSTLAEHAVDVFAFNQTPEKKEETNVPAPRQILKRSRNEDCIESPPEDDDVEPPCKKQSEEDTQTLLQQLKTLKGQIARIDSENKNLSAALTETTAELNTTRSELAHTKTVLSHAQSELYCLHAEQSDKQLRQYAAQEHSETVSRELESEKERHLVTQISLSNVQRQQTELLRQLEDTKTQLSRTDAHFRALGTKHLAVYFDHRTKHPECNSCGFAIRKPKA